MRSFEFALLDWIQGNLRNPVMDLLMPAVTTLGNGGLIWIALAGILLLIPRYRKAGAAVLAGLALEVICCNLVLKPLIARVRPCDVNTAVQLLVARPDDFSFPSGHTGASFAAVTALYADGEQTVYPGSASGGADLVFQAIPVCPLSDRRSGGDPAGSCCRVAWEPGHRLRWREAAPWTVDHFTCRSPAASRRRSCPVSCARVSRCSPSDG